MTTQEELNHYICDQRSKENVAGLPLNDIRVIDMATVMAAPFGATLLGDFGAEVIKVEPPGIPDAIRTWGVLENEIHPFWSVFGRNKFPVTINLKSPHGKEILLRLIEKSDVLIENMRPGTLDRLGFDVEKILAVNPGLVIARVSGYGQTGPYASKPGFGTLAEGYSGFTYLNAQPGGVPTNAPLSLADCIGGVHLAFAVMIALRGQKRGQKGGEVIDMSLYEPLFGMLGPDFLTYFITGEVPEPKGNELSYVVPRNSYMTRDKRWVVLSGAAQKPFERLMEVVGHPEMNDDPRYRTNEERIKNHNRRVINKVISDWIGNKDLDEVIEICDRLGITIGRVATMEDIAKDIHYRERGSLIEAEDPVTKTRLRIPNVPFQILNSPGKVRFPGLPQGSANEVIYKDLLGYSSERIDTLKNEGVI